MSQSTAIVSQMACETFYFESRPDRMPIETKAMSLVTRESPLNHNGINKESRNLSEFL